MEPKEQIKQNLGVVQVVRQYIELKKAGRNYKGVCPFHAENTPSLMVSPELQIFKCFGCGESGDIFTFVQKIEGIDFSAALEKLAEQANVTLPKRTTDPNRGKKSQIFKINAITAKFYAHLLNKHPVGKEALTYLTKGRKLKGKTLTDFELGFAPPNWDTLYAFLTKKGFTPSELLAAGVIVQRKSGDGYIDKFRKSNVVSVP